MQHLRFLHLWVMLALVVGTGTIAASTPAACSGAHCVYLPLVSTPELTFVSNVQLRGTKYEDVAVSGEVNVTTSTPVYSVTLEVRTYDTEGLLLSTATGSPVLDATLPGQPNLFYFYTGATDDQNTSRADVRVIGYSRTHPRTFRAPTIDVTVEECAGSALLVKGTITNAYQEPLEEVKGVLWDSSSPYGPFPRQFAARLKPFQTVPFSASLAYEGCGAFGIPPTYQIAAQGVVPQ